MGERVSVMFTVPPIQMADFSGYSMAMHVCVITTVFLLHFVVVVAVHRETD